MVTNTSTDQRCCLTSGPATVRKQSPSDRLFAFPRPHSRAGKWDGIQSLGRVLRVNWSIKSWLSYLNLRVLCLCMSSLSASGRPPRPSSRCLRHCHALRLQLCPPVSLKTTSGHPHSSHVFTLSAHFGLLSYNRSLEKLVVAKVRKRG